MSHPLPLTVPTPFPVGDVHLYLLPGPPTVLVDAGPRTPEAWKALTAALRAHGRTPADLDEVWLTHHHLDHVGWVDRLAAEGVRIRAHPETVRRLAGGRAFWARRVAGMEAWLEAWGVSPEARRRALEALAPLEALLPPPVEAEPFHPDEVRTVGGRSWRVLFTPGHAPGHVSFWAPDDGTLIAGDAVLPHITPNPVLEPSLDGAPPFRPLVAYHRTLRRLSRLRPLERLLPSHGPVGGRPREALLRIRCEQRRRRRLVRRLLAQGIHTPEPLTEALFGPVPPEGRFLALSEAIAYLEWLGVEPAGGPAATP